jgi:O-antigen/teichoic acid export membrane protein
MSEPSVVEVVVPASGQLLKRARRWGGILAAFFSAQSAVQLLSVGAGLLFVNFLPVGEFALYTLANSVLTFFTFASDLGSTSSLVYFYRASAPDTGSFELMRAAVASLRRKAFLLGGVATAIALPVTAAGRGLPSRDAWLCTAAVLAGVWFQIESSLGVLVLRLHDEYARSYRAEIAGALLRVCLAGALVSLGGRVAWLAALTGTAATALVARLVRTKAPESSGDVRAAQRRVLRYLQPSLPSALYFSIQSPLVVWLSATFGSTRTIAEVGAIGRLGLLVGVFGSLTSVVFLPRLARIRDDREFRVRVLQFGSLMAVLGGALFAAAALFPRAFLALLGPNYKGLHAELLLVVGGAWLSLVGGYLVGVNLSRAWNRWETPSVAVLFLCQLGFATLLPMATTAGVLRFGILSAATGLLLQVAISSVGFVRPAFVQWKI